MDYYSSQISKLIEELSRLPGIGAKTAQRLAFHSQMIALRYGTLPIVRETGGLRDTVQSYNEYEDTGNGFSFANYNAHEMLGAIRYALQTLQSPKRKHGLIQRAMESDNSFAKSAKIYLDMYNSVL